LEEALRIVPNCQCEIVSLQSKNCCGDLAKCNVAHDHHYAEQHRLQWWNDFDDLYIMWWLSTQGCAFWGFHWSAFRGSYPQKPQFCGHE